MSLTIGVDVKTSFLDLYVVTCYIENVTVAKIDPKLEAFKEEVIRETRSHYDIDSMKDKPVFRVYRDFFWTIKVDPTKNRPAAEALIRRVVSGKPLPRINTLVDAYNLASIKTAVAIAAFDADRLRGDLKMRYAKSGEKFLGIGMNKPLLLRGGEIVVQDEKKLVAVYPYRDAEDSKVTEATRNVLLLFCGVPRISLEELTSAVNVASDFVTRFCGGTIKT
ncbi:MAG: phenylalanine--tRNA ligase beta subunit-related protein [Candidatus Bathyarchaeota archaeon]|nr:phenylalanine--tRNA ligase beta subunit-related protein [Candidatus Bathyarchaeota archaeon]